MRKWHLGFNKRGYIYHVANEKCFGSVHKHDNKRHMRTIQKDSLQPKQGLNRLINQAKHKMFCPLQYLVLPEYSTKCVANSDIKNINMVVSQCWQNDPSKRGQEKNIKILFHHSVIISI
jgi:hypothetical protein